VISWLQILLFIKFNNLYRYSQVPRVCIIGGKAAPGYDMAKRIIKLVSAVGDKINEDASIDGMLKLVFLPDYNVSSAEVGAVQLKCS
jgi:starch phosphorylase